MRVTEREREREMVEAWLVVAHPVRGLEQSAHHKLCLCFLFLPHPLSPHSARLPFLQPFFSFCYFSMSCTLISIVTVTFPPWPSCWIFQPNCSSSFSLTSTISCTNTSSNPSVYPRSVSTQLLNHCSTAILFVKLTASAATKLVHHQDALYPWSSSPEP